jgi:mono-ADP-ribosyltransferase sirtuin 6
MNKPLKDRNHQEKKLDYNSRLMHIEDKGLCGDPEIIDDPEDLETKLDALASMLICSKHCVVFTGAGISTSAGIPDFRGPNGVWTREQRGETFSNTTEALSFEKAKPTKTHKALAILLQKGIIKHIVSQNVDGLHLRSGIPQENLSELHGNLFMEVCEKCKTRYFRDYDVGGMGLKYTGNKCDDLTCRGKLKDFAIDWDTELPEDIFRKAKSEIKRSDLVICIGTSLRIRPAGNMPASILRVSKAHKEKGNLVIINLQATHLDSKALKIHHYSDFVMQKLFDKLSLCFDHDSIFPDASDSRDSKEADNDLYFIEETQQRKRKKMS